MQNVKIFDKKYDACFNLATDLKRLNKQKANVAISGGSSPILLFEIMKDKFYPSDFNNLNFFWVDERFVEVDNSESNFGNFSRILIDNNIINRNHVFPFLKLTNRDQAIDTVTKEIKDNISFIDGYPSFDLIILGAGDDGHTASLFPNNLEILDSNQIIIKSNHPQTNQKRLSLTKNVINNAKSIVFLTFGESKAEIVKRVLIENDKTLPSSYIKRDDSVIWYLDKQSAALL